MTSFDYTYDNAGNRTRKAALDYSEDYAYDLLYRLTGVDRGGAQARRERFGYDPVGNRLVEQVASNVTSATYNEKNQLLSRQGGGRMRWRGQLDEVGNVAFTTATVNGQPARMLAGNVFEADLDMQAGANAVTLRAVDASGNVTTRTYSVNVTADGATYTYDANGNLSTKTTGSDTWAYTWNAENQLTRVTKNGVEVATFKYDPVGRRAEKVASGMTTTWTYDGEDILREARGTATTTYIHGPGIDEPLAKIDQAGNTTYLHADGLGSIVKETNSAGAVTLTRRYDTWGNLESGADQAGYAFTGREWDPEINLYYYRARYYDPKVGRFISEDPAGAVDGPNLYRYAHNNPSRFSDPSGLYISVDEYVPDFLKSRIEYSLDLISRTKCGGRYIRDLMRSKQRNIKIRIQRDPDGRGFPGSHWNWDTDIVYIDLMDLTDPKRGYNSVDGLRRNTLEQLLAHELGHAYQGSPVLRDAIQYEREAVSLYENPVNTELGRPARTDPITPYGWEE
ncbi:MAG: RHS repeat-associated core domain-containing protein [Vicinamibacteria bacterium]|nr:RHS repeat-associated core domain-containing protein [Vicinamibacteria bacterium]